MCLRIQAVPRNILFDFFGEHSQKKNMAHLIIRIQILKHDCDRLSQRKRKMQAYICCIKATI